jgi:hypothetical protein
VIFFFWLVGRFPPICGSFLPGDSSDPRKVIVQKMSFVTAGREDIVLDLTGEQARGWGRGVCVCVCVCFFFCFEVRASLWPVLLTRGAQET